VAMRRYGHHQAFSLTLSDVALAMTLSGHVTLSRRIVTASRGQYGANSALVPNLHGTVGRTGEK
jgi:hypothetical protein